MKKNFNEKDLFDRISQLTNVIKKLITKGSCSYCRLIHMQYQVSHLRWQTRRFEKIPYEYLRDTRIKELESSYYKLENLVRETATVDQIRQLEDSNRYAATFNSLYLRDHAKKNDTKILIAS